jgi:hypothetical protein
MSVFKRIIKTKKGNSLYWYIDYTINGRCKWEGVGMVGQVTKADARKLLALRKTEVLQGKFNLANKTVYPNFADFSKDYIEYAKDNKRSWDRDARSLRCLVPYFGSYTLDEISLILIERYKLERKRSVCGLTINIELSLEKYV